MTYQMVNMEPVFWRKVRHLAIESNKTVKALIIGLLEDAIAKNINTQTYRRKNE